MYKTENKSYIKNLFTVSKFFKFTVGLKAV